MTLVIPFPDRQPAFDQYCLDLLLSYKMQNSKIVIFHLLARELVYKTSLLLILSYHGRWIV